MLIAPATNHLDRKRLRRFLTTWAITVAGLFALLSSLGFTPPGLRFAGSGAGKIQRGQAPASLTSIPQSHPAAMPVAAAATSIIIPAAGIEAAIVFPAGNDFETLNRSLASGVVHYPGSTLPGEVGNILLFGHSSRLPAVRNPAYAAFNRLADLAIGDIVRIRHGGAEHWYRVTSSRIQAADDARIALDHTGRRLTLATCTTFGSRENRFVIEAEYLASYPITVAAL